ncbi:MAG: glutamine synthetase [Silicimonas sp.]|nr:glutamine synthetase [Silicimonas sp.]
MEDWLEKHDDVRMISAAAVDLNGQARGKRMPVKSAPKALAGGLRMPLSALNLDILGNDIEDSPLVFESGDRDGILRPTERGFVPMPWLANPAALLPMWMFNEDGTPFAGDPRHALDAVLSGFRAKGLVVVAATELEFFLIDDSGDEPRPAISPRSGKRRKGGDILGLRALDAFDAFFSDLYAACEAMDIPADAATSEAGTGQFEITLGHGPAMKAADDTWLFKMLAKGLARKHEFAASFMSKPYPDLAGTGLHLHFSVLDSDGRNIFDDGGPKGTEVLRHAVAGCLAAMQDSTLILAPHSNSYDRLVPGAHAPTKVAWAYENRTAALRIPGGAPVARRIEHRVAGGDINPYLVLSSILGAALAGIDDKADPPAPITGDAYSQNLDALPGTWSEATSLFENSTIMSRIFPRLLIQNLLLTKRQEQALCADLTPAEQTEIYLESV